eukprot:scaffold278_cov195-Amphora_coffeaeformis.AAC.4
MIYATVVQALFVLVFLSSGVVPHEINEAPSVPEDENENKGMHRSHFRTKSSQATKRASLGPEPQDDRIHQASKEMHTRGMELAFRPLQLFQGRRSVSSFGERVGLQQTRALRMLASEHKNKMYYNSKGQGKGKSSDPDMKSPKTKMSSMTSGRGGSVNAKGCVRTNNVFGPKGNAWKCTYDFPDAKGKGMQYTRPTHPNSVTGTTPCTSTTTTTTTTPGPDTTTTTGPDTTTTTTGPDTTTTPGPDTTRTPGPDTTTTTTGPDTTTTTGPDTTTTPGPDTATTPQPPLYDLIIQEDFPLTATAEQELTYRVTVRNASSQTVQNVQLFLSFRITPPLNVPQSIVLQQIGHPTANLTALEGTFSAPPIIGGLGPGRETTMSVVFSLQSPTFEGTIDFDRYLLQAFRYSTQEPSASHHTTVIPTEL